MHRFPLDLSKHIQVSTGIALEEDLGNEDVTATLLPKDQQAQARLVTRETMILCGTAWVEAVFQKLADLYQIDPIEIQWLAKDGDTLNANSVICTLSGQTRALLTGERTAMNFLQTLSGTATTTAQYTQALKPFKTKVLDTRKTIPGLRLAQKYAVFCGGGQNHRIGLFDAFLIKENHIAAAGSISKAVQQAKQNRPELLVEVEVESIAELKEALLTEVNRIMLDNFTLEMLKEATALPRDKKMLEVSGNITLDGLREIGTLGIDYVSVGALTKHIHAIDLSMRLEPVS